MATKYLAKTYEYGLLLQDDWANTGPVAPGDNFKTIPYNAGVTVFEPDVKSGLYNTSGQSGIHKEIERFYVDGRSGLPKINFSMPADVKTIAPHLAGALSTVTEAGAASYNKAFSAGGLTGTIDFNGDDAPIHYICCKNMASNDDGIILENAIIENLNLSWDFLANGEARFVQMSGNWVGNEMNFEQTTGGTWSTTTFTPMGATDTYTMTTFTVDGVSFTAQNVRRITFNIANNVTTDSATTVGKPNNYDVSPIYTSTIILDYNATTEKVLKDFQDGATVIAVVTSSISSGTDGHFSFGGLSGKLQKQPFIYNGEFAGIELDVLWHSASTLTPVQAALTDYIQWGY